LQVLRFVEVVEVQVRYEILKSLHHRLWVLLELSLEPNKATSLFSKFNKNLNVEHCHVLNKVKFSKQISVTLLKKSISLTLNFKQVIAFSDYR